MTLNIAWWRSPRRQRETPRPALTASRYIDWCEAELFVAGPFAGPPFSAEDLALANAWGHQQSSCGIHIHVLRDTAGQPRVLAIAGAPEACPDFIIYPVTDGYQTDEPFDSSWSASLLAALCSIRPMSASSRPPYPGLPSSQSARRQHRVDTKLRHST